MVQPTSQDFSGDEPQAVGDDSARSLADTLDDTNVVATHVERHRDDLLVKFHADLFLGFGHADDASLFAFESARNDLHNAADFNAAGDGLWFKVGENVLKRRLTGKHRLGVLERGLVDASASGWVAPTGAADELLNVVLSARFHEHVAPHGGGVEDGHDFTLQSGH